MRVRWLAQYRGSDPANCRRKVERVLGITSSGETVHPWVDSAHVVEFFSTLEAGNWDSALPPMLDVASQFSPSWAMTISPGYICGRCTDRKVANVESLSFEMSADDRFRLPTK